MFVPNSMIDNVGYNEYIFGTINKRHYECDLCDL